MKLKKQILRYGEWKHKNAPNGVLKITKDYAQQVVDNYNRVPTVPVYRGHVPDSQAEQEPEKLIITKNIEGLELGDDGVYAKWEMSDKELDNYNDVSASIDPSYEDHETGEFVGPVLKHIAMVINPYIKKLNPFIPLNDNSDYLILLSEIDMEEDKTKEVEETTEEVTEEPKVEEVVTEEVVEETTEESEPTETAEEEAPVETEVEPEAEVEEDTKLSELAAMKVELAELKAKNSKSEAEKFVSDLLTKGKILPKMKDTVVNLAMAGEQTINLAEGEITVMTLLSDLFKDMPSLVNLSEKGVDLEDGEAPVISTEMEKSIRATLKKENPNITEEQVQDRLSKYAHIYSKHDK